MNILLVLCHPRRGSFTGAVADSFAANAISNGHTVEWADLYRKDFDPVLREDDEPDWENASKRYSDAVQTEMARIQRNDAIVLAAPIWWWSFPAMLKGWIDRVWNLGFAYGDNKLDIEKGLIIGTCASSANVFAQRKTDTAIHTQLGDGIMQYCGINNFQVELLHDALDGIQMRDTLLAKAAALGALF